MTEMESTHNSLEINRRVFFFYLCLSQYINCVEHWLQGPMGAPVSILPRFSWNRSHQLSLAGS